MSEQDDSSTHEPAEGDHREDVLREEQEGKGYGSRYGDDEGDRDPSLTEE